MLELMGGSVKHDHRHPVFNFLFEVSCRVGQGETCIIHEVPGI
ncbi:hypothetical protein NGA_0697000 [Nannochloropsis gaditana CCMP526]|nr:hypothetical protein NGA_0697000 [Nannochloropsis gaditana CCMP526]EKU23395.1 hypothetical protein NGA_0697000 [Nannochloropsis gaditana CCMP526]|eukprot:XP_005852436.1 hypothetical protein NGA_0697000 [Nannochloropsis gaditana CCMP526]